MHKSKLPDEVFDIFELGIIYAIVAGKIRRVKIFLIDWFRNQMLVRHEEGWVYILDPYDYKKTWSSNRFDLDRYLKKGRKRHGRNTRR